ncbi:putative aromatic ring monooxygenase [Paraburkholderia ribeironis]|uniref:Putative aromatic ring monooxygenase n=1 Tax=Paraburkholderia ribeironis TaxID=1247936 RepID=A0A1N7RZM0_9BURK|nr:FAD-dependent monooxygenase [Paraburkholderia ribeironis]SIT40590.1 putative aromatic ring monooxygenase [Paraburkholderia ribeironis]
MFVRQTYKHTPDRLELEGTPIQRAVVIVGGGLVGLTMALDLSCRGIPALVLDDDNTVSVGGRAICHAHKTLQVWDRLGCLEPVLANGVCWSQGKIFHAEELITEFSVGTTGADGLPPFINLQQYYVEEALINAIAQHDDIDLRWNSKARLLKVDADHVLIEVEGPHSTYQVTTDWLIAADGARSAIRTELGLECEGIRFEDRFLNTSVRLPPGRTAERLFWFDHPSHPGGTILMHQQADNLWRIDFELRDDEVDVATNIADAAVRITGLVGDTEDIEVEWTSQYAVQSKTMSDYRHGRIIFIGDSAHQVSPYGARGGNSGVPDTENLGWKLKRVLTGKAPEKILDSYSDERVAAARENVTRSSQSTEFITPHSFGSHLLRQAVLLMAKEQPLARLAVNTGRLSEPMLYADSPLNTPDEDHWPEGAPMPGAIVPAVRIDTPLGSEGLYKQFNDDFVVVRVSAQPAPIWLQDMEARGDIRLLDCDPGSDLAAVLGAGEGAMVLVRPDMHICARWQAPRQGKLENALLRAQGHIKEGMQ